MAWSAEKWKKHFHKLVTLPSGAKALLRPPNVDLFAYIVLLVSEKRSVIDKLDKISVDKKSGVIVGVDEEVSSFLSEFVREVLPDCFIEPKLVTADPEADEICVKDIKVLDSIELFKVTVELLADEEEENTGKK